MRVFVQTTAGALIDVEIGEDALIMDVKRMLCNRPGVPPDQQHFMFGGRVLDDGRRLADYGVANESSIRMVARAPLQRQQLSWLHAGLDVDAPSREPARSLKQLALRRLAVVEWLWRLSADRHQFWQRLGPLFDTATYLQLCQAAHAASLHFGARDRLGGQGYGPVAWRESARVRRLSREMEALLRAPSVVRAELVQRPDSAWPEAVVLLYQCAEHGSWWSMQFTYPADYPHKAPSVAVDGALPHASYLSAGDGWSPLITTAQIVEQFVQTLRRPCNDDGTADELLRRGDTTVDALRRRGWLAAGQ